VTALKGDKVAREEVRSRLSHARDRVEKKAGSMLGVAGHTFHPEASVWIRNGSVKQFQNPKEFQRWLSSICDEIFSKAPEVHNELINRQNPSATSVGARKKLITAMYQNPEKEQLGIEGTPAEASMYKSILQEGGFHSKTNEGYKFTKPNQNWETVWNIIDEFVKDSEEQRRVLTELFDSLKSPPFGLREGIIPIVFMAYAMKHWNDLAFYEDGVYVPNIGIETIERLLKRPETFEIQSYALDEQQKRVLKALSRTSVQGHSDNIVKEGLLPIVRSLVKQASDIQPYTEQTSKLQPPEAIQVRDTLLNATSPKDLLFHDLPSIFDLSLESSDEIEQFVDKIKHCMTSIHRAYPALLDKIENGIRQTFNLPDEGPAIEAVSILRGRAKKIRKYALEGDLQVFVREAASLNNQRDWREVLGRVVQNGIPPSNWSDEDVSNFQIKLQQIADSFMRLEELAAQQEESTSEQVFRVGLLDKGFQERRAVISLDKEIEEEVMNLEKELEKILNESIKGNGNRKRVKIAALARTVMDLLDSQNE